MFNNRLALFSGLERKICAHECPHSLYIQNYSSAAASCIILRKWLFDISKETALCSLHPVFADFCFWQVRSKAYVLCTWSLETRNGTKLSEISLYCIRLWKT